ncbi:MAG: hypothetical protein ATN31_00930 [Candidatus Epulonipiscioides saccharophilum]|nr:MAG: hypothetical protein ATN31_00930 [Epulopiscium sp. AS2M-Bin001]
MQGLVYATKNISGSFIPLSDSIHFISKLENSFSQDRSDKDLQDNYIEGYPKIKFLELERLEPIKPPADYFFAVISGRVTNSLHEKAPLFYEVPIEAMLAQYLEAVAEILLYAIKIQKKPILYSVFDHIQLGDNYLLDKLIRDWISTVNGIAIFYNSHANVYSQIQNIFNSINYSMDTNELPNHTFLKISSLKNISDINQLYKPKIPTRTTDSSLYEDLFYRIIPDSETIYATLNPLAPTDPEFYEKLNLTYIPLLHIGGLINGKKKDFDNAKNAIQEYINLEYDLSILTAPKITQTTIDKNLITKKPSIDKIDDGSSVIIGVIDTQNIQINHPMLIHDDGKSKIEYIFDQQTEGELYNEDINDLIPLQEDLTKLTDGTALMLLANGYDSQNSTTNYLPNVHYVAAKIKPASKGLQNIFGGQFNPKAVLIEDILICITKLIEYAAKEKKPIVLCIQYGSNISSHDGTTYLERILTQYAGLSGVSIVSTVGSEGDKRHHKRNNTHSVSHASIMITKPNQNIVAVMWTMYPGGVSATLQNKLTGEKYSLDDSESYVVGNGTLYVQGKQISANNGSVYLMFRLENFDPGEYIVINDLNHPQTGIVDFWLAETNLNPASHLKDSDALITITSISNINGTICVGAYDPTTLTITRESGRGYTRVGNILPTCVIDAVNILAPLNEMQSVTLNGPSVALGLMAGEAAGIYSILIKKQSPYLPNTPVMSYWLSANLSQLGTISYPNERQGYGIYTLQNLKNWLLINGIINGTEGVEMNVL